MEFKEFISNFDSVRLIGEGKYQCKCPCHADQKASLTVTDAADRILLHCHAGCKTEDIVRCVDLSICDLFKHTERTVSLNYRYSKLMNTVKKSEKEKPTDNIQWYNIDSLYEYYSSNEFKPTAQYEYYDENSVYQFTKLRLSNGKDKRMSYITRNNNKFCFKKLGNSTIYGLRELIKFKEENHIGYNPIYYVEGEKDVETMRSIGLVAVTAGGVNDWKKEYARFFTGCDLVVIPDNDSPGKELARRVLTDCLEVVKTMKVLLLDNFVQEKGDISDFIQQGYGKEAINIMINELPQIAR